MKKTFHTSNYFSIRYNKTKKGITTTINMEDIYLHLESTLKKNFDSDYNLRIAINNDDVNKTMKLISEDILNWCNNIDIIFKTKIYIDFKNIDWENNFNFKQVILLNNYRNTIIFNVGKSDYLESFVKAFVEVYNYYVDAYKNYKE